MIIPRWQRTKKNPEQRLESLWDKFIAFFAIANLSWMVFDISYIPLRGFWVNNLHSALDSSRKEVLETLITDFTSRFDQVKGIKKRADIEELKLTFYRLDQSILNKGLKDPSINQLINKYELVLESILGKDAIIPPRDFNKLEAIKVKINSRSGINSSKYYYPQVLNTNLIERNGWEVERKFWLNNVINTLNTSYSIVNLKRKDSPSNILEIEIPLKIIFLMDILVKVNFFKKRFPNTTIRDCITRRWIDIPLFLPYLYFLRPLPLIERILKVKLINLEPIRAVISQWIVAFLAIEIFEVLTIRAINSVQNIISSPILPSKIRKLSSHQSVKKDNESNISEFIRIWIPLLLKRVGPNMRNQIIELFDHALQKSIGQNPISSKIKGNIFIENAESAISFQLASGMVDSMLGVSKNAGSQFAKKDVELERLTLKVIDKFWEELALAMENDSTLRNSQVLINSILEELKISSLNEMKKLDGPKEIINELDKLNFN